MLGLLLALALAVAACGGGKSSGVASLSGSGKATATTNPGGSKDPQQAALAFARCMRQHGVNIPDPGASGGLDLRGFNSDSPKFKAAQQACQQYTPNGGKQQTSSGGGR
jgi:hypothetical protein